MSDMTSEMTPARPYFVRAVYEWIIDNDCTPFLVVDAEQPDVQVPMEYVENGQIILNLAPSAIVNLHISNDYVMFSARFKGVSREICVAMSAVMGIYAKENGQGMVFPDDGEYGDLPAYEADLEEVPAPVASFDVVEGSGKGVDAESGENVEADGNDESDGSDEDSGSDPDPSSPPPKGRPQLKVVK